MTSIKSKAFAVVAGLSTLLAVPTFTMADRHGDHFRGGDRGRWDGGHRDSGHRDRSHFSFSFGLGAVFTPRYDSYDYYAPTYRTYYEPAPVYYSAPAVYAPAPVCDPAPVVYAAPTYYAPTYYYAPAPRYYNSYYAPRVSISVGGGGRYYYRH